jgi:type VI secretion system VgrG family protein
MIELSFEIEGIEASRLVPFAVDGTEELSTLFSFDILCLSPMSQELLGPECLGRSATLVMALEGAAPRTVKGVIEDFSILDPTLYYQAAYRIRLAPSLSLLRLSRHNRIYGTVEPISVATILPSMLQGTLQRGSRTADPGLPILQHDVRLRSTYPQFDHVTQFEESDFAFLSRLTEHWGVYYFFEHHNESDLVVFSDDAVFSPMLADAATLQCTPARSADGPEQPNMVQRFEARYQQVSNRIFLQDYNERIPHVPLLVSAEIDQKGRGYVVEYGDYYRTPDEGAFLARVRAEELRSHKVRFSGRSTAVSLAPGYGFELTGHDHAAWDDRYLVLSVRHHARRPLPGVAGLSMLGGLESNKLASSDAGVYGYRNDFTAMQLNADMPFRPQRRTPRPRIDGLLNGRIETSLDNRHPHLNQDGWYRVRLPLDLGTAPDGQGSRWIRKAEPYGGPNNGMHFPLPPDTDVVVACINGDPDRPVIVGAVPSADTPSVVTNALSHLNRIQTRSGIVFTMSDFTK